MSDLSMYELDDIVWDEFDQTDDRIVPHCNGEHASQHSLQGDSCKKPRHEVTSVSSNATNSVAHEKEEIDPTSYNKKRNILEKDFWPDTPVVFSAVRDADTVKEMTSLASDDNPTSSCLVKKGNSASIDNELSANDYSVGHISQEDDLSFCDNDGANKESSDLLYYNWPDIGNFEDVDRMFRSCDSSFGLEVTGNEDGSGWFSSAGPIEDYVETLKSEFKFPSPLSSALKSTSEDHDPQKLNKQRDEFKLIGQGGDSRENQFQIATSEHAKKDNPMVNLAKKQSKHQHQSKGKRKGQWVDNATSFYCTGGPQNNDGLSSMPTTEEAFTSTGNRQQSQNLEPGSFQYLHNRVPYVLPDYSNAGGPSLTIVKVENKGPLSLSSNESSYGSNQLLSFDNPCDPSFDVAAMKLDEKREKVHHPHGGFEPIFNGNTRNVGMMVQPSICNPTPFQKQVHQSANEIDSQVGGFQEISVLNVPESTSMKSELDESSLEATSFRQLQQVMEQLDLRIKLCIRDSLYRLARSAEQRDNYANMSDAYSDYRNPDGSLIVEGTNKCTGFMDVETDTNPIDRCMAHLLFHRPSETHGMPAQNPLPHKSNTIIRGSITSPPLMAGKLVCQEENVGESDDKMADN